MSQECKTNVHWNCGDRKRKNTLTCSETHCSETFGNDSVICTISYIKKNVRVIHECNCAILVTEIMNKSYFKNRISSTNTSFEVILERVSLKIVYLMRKYILVVSIKILSIFIRLNEYTVLSVNRRMPWLSGHLPWFFGHLITLQSLKNCVVRRNSPNKLFSNWFHWANISCK